MYSIMHEYALMIAVDYTLQYINRCNVFEYDCMIVWVHFNISGIIASEMCVPSVTYSCCDLSVINYLACGWPRRWMHV